MFSEAGQLAHLAFAGVRGGGGKGGGGGGQQQYTPPPPTVLTDPVSGKSFVDRGGGITGGQTGYMPMPGGGYAMIPQGGPEYKSAQDQLNEEITQRQAGEKATSEANKAQAATDAATAETTFQGRRQSAYDTAMQDAMSAIRRAGGDPNQYMASDITPALQRQFQSVQDLDPNPMAAFPTSLGDTIVGNITGARRQQAGTALNQIFTPNYAQNLLPDTMTDQYSGDILNEQFNPLAQQLQNAQKRGTLSPAGYQAAVDAMNQKRTAAQATVKNLGQGIIANDRSGLNDIISGARSAASGLGLADQFDPSSFAGQAGTRAQSYQSDFGGALRNAVGNPTGATAGAGQNLSPSFVSQDELAARGRGLGNTGAF
jgi:hypothetical protein